jgi:flagellar biogenesis protein FliO
MGGKGTMDGKLPGGWAGWLLRRWRGTKGPAPRLRLVDRITLGPRQSLCLVEADGRKVLLATSADGAPAFFALDRERVLGKARRLTW